MALQVWLPLNGDTHNQGLIGSLDVYSSNSYTDGKIGSAITCSDSYPLYTTYSPKRPNNFSVCAWIYRDNDDSWQYALSESRIDSTETGYGLHLNYKQWVFSNVKVSAGEIQINKWHHVALTIDTNMLITSYLDGHVVESKQCVRVPTYDEATGLGISCFRYDNNNIYRFKGRINDYRYYDHCLSPKEVKEIAKGLVLHYPLNDAYVEETVNLGNTSASYSNMTDGLEFTANSWGGDAGTVTYYKSGGYNNLPYKVYHKTASGNGGIFSKTANDISIVAGKTYTMSIWVKASRNFLGDSYSFNINGVTSSDDNHYITYSKQFPFTTEWTRISRTFTATESDAGMYGEMSIIYDNWDTDYYVYFSGFQIEEKDHATPYTPNTRNETTVYDCSGYQNNGTITGSLSCSADSPRYKTCIETNASQIIHAPIGNGIPSSDLTVACWVKRPETIDSNSMRCWLQPPSGNNQRFYFRILPQGNTAIFNIGFGVNGYGNKTVDATWHHLAATTSSDGKTISVYVDGILTNTGTEENAFNLAGDLKLATNFIGKMSDFRFYRTALSAEDIKELYDTSAYVSDNGTLLTYNLEE